MTTSLPKKVMHIHVSNEVLLVDWLLMDEFMNLLHIFWCFASDPTLWTLIFATDIWSTLKCVCHSKTYDQPTECSKHFEAFSSRFVELYINFDASTLLKFASHHKDRRVVPIYYKTSSNNWTQIESMKPIGRLTWSLCINENYLNGSGTFWYHFVMTTIHVGNAVHLKFWMPCLISFIKTFSFVDLEVGCWLE